MSELKIVTVQTEGKEKGQTLTSDFQYSSAPKSLFEIGLAYVVDGSP